MVKSESKILLVIILTIIMIFCIATTVFADNAIIIGGNTTYTDIDINNILSGTNIENIDFTNVANMTTDMVDNSIVINPNNNSVSQYNATNTTNTTNTNIVSLPKTGESDIYVVIAMIVVCSVSAIYAYKKIRDYNV